MLVDHFGQSEMPAALIKYSRTISHVELQLNGTCQLQVYANDVNLVGKNMNTTKKYTCALLDANKEFCRECIKYRLMYHHQMAG